MVNLDKAEFIGEGEWVKNSAYQVYKLGGKYYSVIVNDMMSKWIMEDTITEIREDQIKYYIG